MSVEATLKNQQNIYINIQSKNDYICMINNLWKKIHLKLPTKLIDYTLLQFINDKFPHKNVQ